MNKRSLPGSQADAVALTDREPPKKRCKFGKCSFVSFLHLINKTACRLNNNKRAITFCYTDLAVNTDVSSVVSRQLGIDETKVSVMAETKVSVTAETKFSVMVRLEKLEVELVMAKEHLKAAKDTIRKMQQHMNLQRQQYLEKKNEEKCVDDDNFLWLRLQMIQYDDFLAKLDNDQ